MKSYRACIRNAFSSLLLCAAFISFSGNAFAYCASRGGSSYEWIQSTNIAGVSRVSGNNSGYASFTQPVINLNAGANSIVLTAGGSYSEYWKVWIDFNNNDDFGIDEVVYSGSGKTLNGSITVPATATNGERGMRISMKYGSTPVPCGNFTYGEVEDYRVNINVVDITPPSIVSRTPAADATNVVVNTAVAATLSEDLDPLSVTSSSISLSKDGLYVPGTVSLSGRIVIFTPTQQLEYGSQYLATLHAGVADRRGNAMPQDTSWFFTSVPPDLTPPTITQLWPRDGETDVDNTMDVQAQFSEPLNPQTVNTSTVRVSKDGVNIAGTVALTGNGVIVQFDPVQPLDYLATYTATISGVKDLAGNALQPDRVWSFTAREYLIPYCTTHATNYQFLWISSVRVNNYTHSVQGVPYAGYANHTSTLFQLGSRSWHSINLTSTDSDTWSNYPARWRVFIDWDQNGFFDNNEVAFSGTGAGTVSGNILVPDYALTGNTRMRVSMQYNADPPACGTFSTGGVSDFRVHIPAPFSDVTPPSVIATSPATDAENANVGAAVTADFSEAINWTSLDEDSFTLTGMSGPVQTTVSYDFQNRRAVLTPAIPLDYSSVYTAALSGVEDVAGNMMQDHSWSFTTQPNPGPTQMISGKVLYAGLGLAGVTVNLSGDAEATAVTDSNGLYLFTNVYAGSYLITPSKAGFDFSPESMGVDVTDANVVALDFNAQAGTVMINGDFETGDFSGFTLFQTPNGMMTQGIVAWDVDQDNVSSRAARFCVGNNSVSVTGYNGGGIYQMLNLGNGDLSVTFDVSSMATAKNSSGGVVQVYFDGALVASTDFGPMSVYSRINRTLSFSRQNVTAGQHELRILLTRPYGFSTSVLLFIDDIVVTGSSTLN